MTSLYTALIIMVALLVSISSYRAWVFKDARKRGKLPQKGKATMFDVRQLLMDGEKELAIEVYGEIFNVNVVKAKKDVEELQRSLKKV